MLNGKVRQGLEGKGFAIGERMMPMSIFFRNYCFTCKKVKLHVGKGGVVYCLKCGRKSEVKEG